MILSDENLESSLDWLSDLADSAPVGLRRHVHEQASCLIGPPWTDQEIGIDSSEATSMKQISQSNLEMSYKFINNLENDHNPLCFNLNWACLSKPGCLIKLE